jgi:MinD-like ATPase involved in chromosome partitioning or flagellar assembly
VPAVVAFYSFKGGVGRTTTVALVASALARSGKRVICVDLDLEAPGLGDFLGASPAPSLLDALLGHAATGLLPTEELVQWVNVHQTKIGVVSAGALDRSYLEKLARLDYLGSASEDDSPVAKALRDVLHRLRTHSPDVILLDCRAGLHDLGGLSLTDLAHVDVLVARDTPQNHHGLRLTLEVLKRRREAPERRVLVVHTFVPFPLTGEPARFTRARMRSKLHDACTVTIYEGSDDCPSRDTDDVPHDAAPFAERNDVTAAQRLSDIEVEAVGTGGLTEIVHRLKALLQPEAP